MILQKYSFGHGDRFGKQGIAQLEADIQALKQGIKITPVWNKSNREHLAVKSHPKDTWKAAEAAVQAANWKEGYLVDADHITLDNVEQYLPYANFFTIDVADAIDKNVNNESFEDFINYCKNYTGQWQISGLDRSFNITRQNVEQIAGRFLFAAYQASCVYQKIADYKKDHPYVIEVSMDEVEKPQTPEELFFILAALSYYQVPLQTIAPKFPGQFSKGIDYIGDLSVFEEAFKEHIIVIDYAKEAFKLPPDLKISVHTGSDKFSLYPIINKLIKQHKTGVHVKTAGTTWLEELIGLASGNKAGVNFTKKIYREAFHQKEKLADAYRHVLSMNIENLPDPDEVDKWQGQKLAKTLMHDPKNKDFNADVRQMMHVAFKIAALYMEEYLELLDQNKEVIAKNVTYNLLERHIKPLFG